MITWLLLAAAATTASVQVQATTLVVTQDGQWSAKDQVRIQYKGSNYRADRASYLPATGEITLSGRVRSTGGAVEIECQRLLVGSGRVEADDARVLLRSPAGELLAELRAKKVVRLGADANFDRVDFSLCTCPDRPWSIGARRVEVAGKAERVSFSVPVFRIREVPVLALPWWSMPLKRRATGILPPILGYDARDGVRARLPIFWAPARWWDLSIEPGFIDGRGPWSLMSLRMRPDASTSLDANMESLHGLGLVDDQRIIGLSFAMRRPGLDWIHRGLFPSDSNVIGVLSTDARARVWRLADAHHYLRLGGPKIALMLQGWSGRRTMAGAGAEADASLGLRTVLSDRRRWGGSALEFALAPMPVHQTEEPTPLVDTHLQFGHRWAPYVGISASLSTRSALFASDASHEPVSRAGLLLEAYSLLDNGRGTKLRPRVSVRTQRVSQVSLRAPTALMGVSGDVLSVGLKAIQSGFMHDYELIAFQRGEERSSKAADVLVAWNGVWSRKTWSLNGRFLFDTVRLEPALFTTSYTWRPKRPGSSLTAGFLRRHIGRDLTIDPDPWLLVNQDPSALENQDVSSDGGGNESVYALLWGTARTTTKHWNLSLTGAVRPLPWSLNSLRLEGGYTSSCKCWGLVAYGGFSGELRPGEVSATPFAGISFNAGRSSALLRSGHGLSR